MKLLPSGIAVLPNDTHISQWVEMSGDLVCDSVVRPYILPRIPVGATVVDAGAFIGDHTVAYLQRVGPTGRVLAFEPNHAAFQCLKHNCPTAECWPCALGQESGTAFLHHGANEAGQYNIGASFLLGNPSQHQVVIVPLDYLRLDRLDFIKIDVEGYELEVLRGAAQTIQRHRPLMVVEMQRDHLQRQGSTPQQLQDILRQYGYNLRPLIEGLTFDEVQLDVLCEPAKP